MAVLTVCDNSRRSEWVSTLPSARASGASFYQLKNAHMRYKLASNSNKITHQLQEAHTADRRW